LASEDSTDAIRPEDDKEEREFTEQERGLMAELREKHGRVRAIRVQGHGLLIFGKPEGKGVARKAWKKYKADRDRPGADVQALEENFQRTCLVHPKGAGVIDAVLDDYPGLDTAFSYTIAQIFGGDVDQVQILGKD